MCLSQDEKERVIVYSLIVLIGIILVQGRQGISTITKISLDPLFESLPLIVVLMIAVLEITYRLMPSIERMVKEEHGTFLLVGIALILIMRGVFALSMRDGGDLREHLHSAFLIFHGKIPYVDFFEHHNPLYWVMLSPIVGYVGHPWATVISLLLSLLCLLLSCALLFFSVLFLTEKKDVALASVLFFLLIFENLLAYDVRPDVPAAVAFFASFFLLLTRTPENAWRNLFLSGALMGISFLFIQKVLIPIGVVSLWIVWESVSRKAWKEVAWFFLPLVSVGGSLFAFYFFIGRLYEYVGFSYLYNFSIAYYDTGDFLKRIVNMSIKVGFPFLLSFFGFLIAFRTYKPFVFPFQLYEKIIPYLSFVPQLSIVRQKEAFEMVYLFFFATASYLGISFLKQRMYFTDYLFVSFFAAILFAFVFALFKSKIGELTYRLRFVAAILFSFLVISPIVIYVLYWLDFQNHNTSDEIDFFYPMRGKVAFACSFGDTFIYNFDASFHWMYPFKFQNETRRLGLPAENRTFREIIQHADVINLRSCEDRDALVKIAQEEHFVPTSYPYILIKKHT